ncbi:MAG: hypothetical protein PF693_17495 [Spirochaetia bacterium]|jgi:hypothetical protein|nr:hypothetical protein [Spirochaetia bacterium]
MKKILTLGIVALVLVTMSGCQFNIFTEFDKIEIPSAAELSDRASSDPDGFIDDVNDYIESDSISEDDADDIVSVLEDLYNDIIPSDPETQQKAAILAGAISINSDPEAKDAVNEIVSIALAGYADMVAVKALFPTDETEFYKMLDSMAAASDAYLEFESTLDGNGDPLFPLTNVERGDIAQYAIVSIVITEIVSTVTPAALYLFVTDPAAITLDGYVDPFDTGGSVDILQSYLDFAGIVI